MTLYVYHEACAGLVRAFREGVREVTPDLLVFRNTTRAGAWSESNDRDGSGQELLARELDFLHLDPYPVAGGYNAEQIPCDMGYISGLARRYGKPLIPWMQAHAYAPNGMGDITPSDMKRMWEQHLPFGPAGMMWLGFNAHPGNSDTEMTFPARSPESWAYAKELFAKVHGATNSSLVTRHSSLAPTAPLAIVRPYSTRAVRCPLSGGCFRNPADCILEAFAMAWGVDNGLQYDIFELPPENIRQQADDNKNKSSNSSLVTVTRHSSLVTMGGSRRRTLPLSAGCLNDPASWSTECAYPGRWHRWNDHHHIGTRRLAQSLCGRNRLYSPVNSTLCSRDGLSSPQSSAIQMQLWTRSTQTVSGFQLAKSPRG